MTRDAWKAVGWVIAFVLTFWFLWGAVNDCVKSSPAQTPMGRMVDCS